MQTAVKASQEMEREFHFTDDDFKLLSRMVYEQAGIVLAEHKRDMVYARLARRLRQLKLSNFADYLSILQNDGGEGETAIFINALTTNLSSFFREAHHFEHLTEHVIYPLLENAKEKRLRIWSAGCSWGAEPYSIAMVLAQLMRGRSGWDARILATDIDTNMLAKAQAGEFENAQLEKIPLAFRHYCRSGSQTGHFKIDQQVKQYITFKPLNLLHDWPMKGRFDVIFCRNVVIYFDKPTQATLFNRMHDIITPKGWLYIGHSESLFKVCDSFTLAGKTIYQKA